MISIITRAMEITFLIGVVQYASQWFREGRYLEPHPETTIGPEHLNSKRLDPGLAMKNLSP